VTGRRRRPPPPGYVTRGAVIRLHRVLCDDPECRDVELKRAGREADDDVRLMPVHVVVAALREMRPDLTAGEVLALIRAESESS
jgi:hypothetical protein